MSWCWATSPYPNLRTLVDVIAVAVVVFVVLNVRHIHATDTDIVNIFFVIDLNIIHDIHHVHVVGHHGVLATGGEEGRIVRCHASVDCHLGNRKTNITNTPDHHLGNRRTSITNTTDH